MDNARVDIASAASRQIESGAERSAALAASRKRAQAAQIASAEAARASQSEQFAISSEAIARAIGANTRLSIERTTSTDVFVYRAIDRDTGEVVREWPPQQFAEFLRDIQSVGSQQPVQEQTGRVFDEQA